MATIEPYKLKNGTTRYRVRYRTPDRRQTDKRGFTTKRDAKEFAARVAVGTRRGGSGAPAGSQWSAGLVDVSDSWRRRQRSVWNAHVKPQWGHWQAAKIEPQHVQEWITNLTTALAPKTVIHIHGVLAGVLDLAVRDRRIVHNPARTGIRLPRITTAEKVALTASQLQALANEVPPLYRSLVWFLGTSGCRWGEMAALRPLDLIGDRRIRLTRSYSKADNTISLTDLKGHEARTIIVPQRVEDMLSELADGKERDALLWEAPRSGGPMRPPKNGHWLAEAVTRCHANDDTFPDHLTAHELRHTAASLMISSGAHIKTIQRQLGHKDASMTLNQYGHLYEDDLDVVADAMDTALFTDPRGQNVGTETKSTNTAT